MSSPLHVHVDQSLREYAQSLRAPDKYSEEGIKLCQKLGQFLEQRLNYVIGLSLGGSIAKRTDVIAPDFDMVITVESQHMPPFDQVFEALEVLLFLNSTYLKIHSKSLKRKKVALTFQFRNGIWVDLVLATNLSREQVFSILARDPSKSYRYSSTLLKDVVGFMRDMSTFVHSMARLGKAWYKTLYFEESVSGGSSIIELISVGAALIEESIAGEEKSELRTLNRILTFVQNIDRLKLVFRESVRGKWEVISSNFLISDFGNQEIARRSCFLIEPANPFNDFLEEMKPSVIEKFNKFAATTKHKLEAIMDGKYTSIIDGKLHVQFHQLFEPQPSDLVIEFPKGIPSQFLISYAVPCKSIYCDMKVNKENLMREPDIRCVIESAQQNLFWTVNSVVRGKPAGQVQISDIRIAINNLVKMNYRKNIVDGTGDHKDYDVTLSVPYEMSGGGYCVKFSMKWNNTS